MKHKIDIDYLADRPFQGNDEAQLFEFLKTALSQPRIELREIGGRVRDARRMITLAGGREIRWLKGARHRVRELAENYEFERGARNCKVYFILLTEEQLTPKPWGLYIGQTSKRIEVRFDEHLDPTNPRRSRHVTRRGWQVLYSLSKLLPGMTQHDSKAVEASLLASFRGECERAPLAALRVRSVKGG
jgi:hypothetical protein